MANSFVNKKVDLTSTDSTTLYTVPSATTAIVKSISANATTELLSAPLIAQESEVIKVTAATANRLHVVLSALEIKPREVTT